MQKTIKACLLLLFCLFFSKVSLQAQVKEHILGFHSDIRVDTTGRVDVTETIWVYATGQSIKRGIVRTIPFYRKNKYGFDKRIDIQVDSVLKNGEAEKFSTAIEGKNLAIYIGDERVTLSPDIYEYTVKYWSRGHVGFFDNYDEIYWNVNGNDWAFDIDSIWATVHLPKGAKFINNSCYTGAKGSTANDCSYQSIGDSIVEFHGSSKFSQNEGLTIATSFTPNIIKRPPPPSAFESFMESNGLGAIFTTITVIMLAIFLFFWRKINTMNGQPIVIPTFDPPFGKSAASLCYLFKKKPDNKIFMACLLSMAVKKAILIKSTGKGSYTLTSLGQTSELSEDELEVYNKLFATIRQDILIGKGGVSTAPGKAQETLQKTVQIKDKIQNYFLSKSPYVTRFALLSLCFMTLWFVLTYKLLDIPSDDLWMVIFLTILPPIFLFLWILFRKSCIGFFILLFTVIPSIAVQIVFSIDNILYKYSIILSWALITINFLFSHYINPMTKKGFQFWRQLEGFKMYLSVAEENRLNLLTTPDLTPEQFEKILPYAVALDLEIKWAKKFEKALSAINYQPSWYLGTTTDGAYLSFTKDFSKSLAHSTKISTPRSSNSGGYGGGGSTRRSSSSSSSRSSSSRSSSSGSRSWSSGSSGRGSSGSGGGGGGGRGW